MRIENRRWVYPVLPFALALSAALSAGCSTGSPTSPSVTGAPGGADRRVGEAGGGNGQCGDDFCFEPGSFSLVAPNGDGLLGTLQETGWLITGGTGRFEGSSGSASLRVSGEELVLLLNFISPRIGARPILATGTLNLLGSVLRASSSCQSGTQLLRTFSGIVESLGLVTLDVETCVPVG